MLRLGFSIFLLVVSFATYAHPGHDHGSPIAALVHLLWLAPLFAGALAYRTYTKKHKAQQKNNRQD